MSAAAGGLDADAMTREWDSTLTFYVNGKEKKVRSVDPEQTLLEFLRDGGLTGTKLGCGEGGCGACTVMVSSFDHAAGRIRHAAINACLMPVCAVDGCAVTTVEGIGSTKSGMHPVQERIARAHGSQCGFCTPGIVMALYTLLRQNPEITAAELEEGMDGNLCRCTGYRPILDAAKTLASDAATCCGGGCCGSGGCAPGEDRSGNDAHDPEVAAGYANVATGEQVRVTTETRASEAPFRGSYASLSVAEPIFPPRLQLEAPRPLAVAGPRAAWYKPTGLAQLMALLRRHPDAVLVRGNTEVGIEQRFKQMHYPVLVHISHVPELSALAVEEGGVRLGAAASLSDVEHFLASAAAEVGEARSRNMAAMAQMLRWFASNQIRSAACLGGNLATASPIADMNPMLMAANAVLRVASPEGAARELPVRELFISYRRTALRPCDVIESVFVPFSAPHELLLPFKQARRREDDISIVSGGIRVALEPSAGAGWRVKDASLCFGGMAATTVAAPLCERALAGGAWGPELVAAAAAALLEDFPLPDDVPGGQPRFRRALPPSFLLKFYAASLPHIAAWSSAGGLPPPPALPARERSAARSFVTEPKAQSRGEHTYEIAAGGLQSASPAPHAAAPGDDRAPVGQPLMHKSALQQCTGEARYVDDMPRPAGTLHAALVTSARARAKILRVNAAPALALDGVEAYFGAEDVPGGNRIGPVIKDEECFASEEVSCFGQVIGVVVAASQMLARRAAALVEVDYEDLEPILDVDAAVDRRSFHGAAHAIESGDLEAERAACEAAGGAVVRGRAVCGGQEHFYLECNATLVVPEEDGALTIFSSTQNTTKTQNFAAHVCGVDASKVVCRMKRMGGAFGGKETRSVFVSCAAAVAASRLGAPVSIVLDRDVDMQSTGQRHAFRADYSAGCDADGALRFLDVALYSNGGCSLDLSQAVMDRALFHLDNAYQWRAVRATGAVCRTNMPSHTAFRGFGGPQGMIICEQIIDHLAAALGTSAAALRERNLYGLRAPAVTHYGQAVPPEAWNVPRLLRELKERGDLGRRVAEVEAFNAAHRYRKRGLAWLPTKFGINFTAKFMNQGGALVHVYTDGTVLVSHGGTEMGQGLHTKMAAVAARALSIPAHLVHVAESATDKVPNASPTAASMSTDLYGMAVLHACEQIAARLRPYQRKMPGAPWANVVQTAYFDRVNLSAQGFYAVPGDRCGYDWDAPVGRDNARRGQPFNYFTQGVAATEVEVDCLTGDVCVLRADVVMDVGASINPAIDVGQIEGAFVQGYGWCTMEECVWGDASNPWVRPGQLHSRGPGTYKIPAFADAPRDLRVHLLSRALNPFAVHSSKAVGEPPFFTAASAFYAIKEAVRSARRDAGLEGHFELHHPATSERIRLACADEILDKVMA